MILFLTALFVLILAIFITSSVLLFKTNKEYKIKTKETIADILDSKYFNPEKILYINKHLTLALNKQETKLAAVKNFNPNNPEYYDYEEIATAFIESIEKSTYSAKVTYVKKACTKVLDISPASKEVTDFIHRVYKIANKKRLEEKFKTDNFSIVSASDWNCSYLWAYSPMTSSFAYVKTGAKPTLYRYNLKREHFTLDIKYNYLELPVMGVAQQVFVYDKNFLNELYYALLNSIKERVASVYPDLIYYDNYNDILYLSNGINSLQSVILDRIEEVFYADNRIYFSLKDEDKVINFIANQEFIKEFENFVTNYNLGKIAQNFDYKSDKLVNTTSNTKFIFDTTRSRVVYCANLHRLQGFSYMSIAFNNLNDVQVEKSGMQYFVRIYTKEKEIIDVTCKKQEVAYFIEAQIKDIINN